MTALPRLLVVIDREALDALLPRVDALMATRRVMVPRVVSGPDVPCGVEAMDTVQREPRAAAVEVVDGVDHSAWSEVVVVAARGRETWRLATTSSHVVLARPEDVA